jgi:pyrroloquinoline quinone biosynthesis protein B
VDLPLDRPVVLTGEGGLLVRGFEVKRHVPRFVVDDTGTAEGSVIGLAIEDPETGGKLVYAPCVGSLEGHLMSLVRDADAVLIDGTFWSDDEPLQIGQRTASQMGHVPVSGPHGSLSWLSELSARHRVYVHINNTNPMLDENGPEHRLVASRGVWVGADGDMFEL